MICANCGNELQPGEKFCARCGNQVPEMSAGNSPDTFSQAAPPVGYQPSTQPQPAPTDYQPGVQPQAAPTGYPDAQPQAYAPSGYPSEQPPYGYPDAQPQAYAPPSYPPEQSPIGYPEAQPQAAAPSGYPPEQPPYAYPDAQPQAYAPPSYTPEQPPYAYPDAQPQAAAPPSYIPEQPPYAYPDAQPQAYAPPSYTPEQAPSGYPDMQPQVAAPSDYPPAQSPYGYPDTQPQVAPTGYPPAQPHTGYPPVQPQAAPPSGYYPGAQPQGAPAGYYPEANAEEAKPGFVQKLKAIPLKKVLMIAVPAVIIIIALIIAIPLITGSGGSTLTNYITWFDGYDEVIVSGNNNPKFVISGELESGHGSIDGSKAVILTDNISGQGGTLWFVTTSGSARIAEDVLAYQLSDSGNGVVYLTDHSSKNDVASLYLYDTSAKKGSLLTEEAPYLGHGEMIGVCISPNGKTVGYVSDYDNRTGDFTGYLVIDGKAPEKLGNNTAAAAVSDGGKHLYYVKNYDGYSGSFNVRSGKNDRKLISDFSGRLFLTLNKDYSQVIFDYQDKSYISRNGNEKEKLGNSTITSILTPRGTQIRFFFNYNSGVTVYGISSFTDRVACTNDGLVYISKNLETSKISSSSTNYYSSKISTNGKKLLFISNSGHLSSIDPTKPNAERREVARNVETFVATSDAETIYYVNEDGELWYVKGNGQPAKISDDASYRYLVLPYNSNKVFFLVDFNSRRGGELYYSANGGRRIPIPGADEVMDLWSTPVSLFFQTYDEDIFRSNGNEAFSRFAEEVSR